MFHSLVAIFAITLLACWSAEGQVIANVTAGGLSFNVNLRSRALIDELHIKRSDFPSNFFFGAVTTATQTEGSATEGGREPSVWDHRIKILPDKIKDSDKYFKAVDGYKRYKEDVKHIKDVRLNSHRFSISWSRILPKGSLSGGINQEGIDHYSSLIDELIKNGITPFVTIYQYDMPQVLQDKYGGYMSRSFLNDFKDYSELLFMSFGDRVKHWFTFNEPKIIAAFGYEVGISPPGRCSSSVSEHDCVFKGPNGECRINPGPCIFGGNSSTEPYIVAHYLILTHATVVKLYREKYQAHQNGEIGIAMNAEYFVPYSESEEDKAAAKRLFDFSFGWFVEPFVHGDYPQSMRDLVSERLPTFSAEEKSLIKGNLGFLGVNYYTSYHAKHKPPPPNEKLRYSFDSWAEQISFKDGDIDGASSMHWPEGLQKLLEYINEKFHSPEIYISENGHFEFNRSNGTTPLDVNLKDPERILFLVRHLYRINKAIKNGVKVKGYFYWNLLDSFEWSFGFSLRCGIYYVDLNDNFRRIPRLSAKWFHNFLQGNETVAQAITC